MSQGIKCEIPESVIIKYISHGHSMRGVALLCGVSHTTIEKHFGHLFKELGGGKLVKARALELVWTQAEKHGSSRALEYIMYEFLGYSPTATIDIKGYSNKLQEMNKDEIAKLLEEKARELREVKEAGDE